MTVQPDFTYVIAVILCYSRDLVCRTALTSPPTLNIGLLPLKIRQNLI